MGAGMSDLISRQDAIDAIQAGADKIDSPFSAFWQGLKIAQNIVESIPSVEPEERTAKVENIEVEWGDDEYVHDRMGDMYHYGNCGNCGETVSHNQKYCHHCGARLEWE